MCERPPTLDSFGPDGAAPQRVQDAFPRAAAIRAMDNGEYRYSVRIDQQEDLRWRLRLLAVNCRTGDVLGTVTDGPVFDNLKQAAKYLANPAGGMPQ